MIIDIVKTTDIPIQHFRPTHMRKILEDDVVEFTRLGGYADYTSSEEPDPKSQEILDVLARGVPQDHLTISSDSNGSMPKWGPNKELIGITYAKMTSLFGQIQSLVKKGLPLEQALCFVTQNVAQALELYPRKGCLAPGERRGFGRNRPGNGDSDGGSQRTGADGRRRSAQKRPV